MVETLFDHYANCEFVFPSLVDLKITIVTLINAFSSSSSRWQMQIQFLIVFWHTFQIQFQPDCNFSKFIGALLSLNAALFTYMFSSFYIRSYNRAAKREIDEKKLVYDENKNEVSLSKKPIKAEWEELRLSAIHLSSNFHSYGNLLILTRTFVFKKHFSINTNFKHLTIWRFFLLKSLYENILSL